MFTSSLVAKDRSTSLTTRLGVSPMKSIDYILGYSISVLPIVLIQNILFFVTAMLLGLNFSINIIYTILVQYLYLYYLYLLVYYRNNNY